MKALLIPNLSKNQCLNVTKETVAKLNSLGVKVLINNMSRGMLSDIGNVDFVDLEEGFKSCDIIIAVGGDGTILHLSNSAVEHDKPLLGINTGRLGFMASLEPKEIHMLSDLVSGNYKEEKRVLLEAEICVDGECKKMTALNDVVIRRDSFGGLIDIDVIVDDGASLKYRADGIILATPSGSTAYSLSSGGPVVEHTADCMVLTPICAHSLMSRSIVMSSSNKLSIKSSCNDPVLLSVDGQENIVVGKESTVKIRKSSKTLRLITFEEKSFYNILKEKLINNI